MIETKSQHDEERELLAAWGRLAAKIEIGPPPVGSLVFDGDRTWCCHKHGSVARMPSKPSESEPGHGSGSATERGSGEHSERNRGER